MANAFIEDPPYLKRVSASSLDYIGFGFLAIWLATLQYVLDKGQELDWFGSHTIAWCVGISAAAFLAFVVRELTARQPLSICRSSCRTCSTTPRSTPGWP